MTNDPSDLATAAGEGLVRLAASEQARLVRQREISPSELVQAHLDRIAELDEQLNAFVTVDAEGARSQARTCERLLGEMSSSSTALPPLLGVPVSVKDLTLTRGLRTTYSSRAFAHFVPDEDASTVRRIREAGLIILGKTNTSEFGHYPFTESLLNGPCRNPWNPALNAGGSSGGAACAVVTGMSALSHGTDAGGSIRIPAAFCGAFGLRPSRGRISLAPRAGQKLAGWSTEGPITRNVTDAALLLDAMSGPEPGDPQWQDRPRVSFDESLADGPGPLRVAIATGSPLGLPVDPQCAAAARRAADGLRQLGHDVQEAAPDWSGEELNGTLMVWSTLTAYYENPDLDLDLVDPDIRELHELGVSSSAIDYVRAVRGLERLARRIAAFWEDFDLLITPVTPMLPVPNGWALEVTGAERTDRIVRLVEFTRPFNITGQPAASLPVGTNADGLPLAAQVVGRAGADATVLQTCAQLESLLAQGTAVQN